MQGMWSCCVFVTKYNLVGNSFAYAYKGGQEVYLKYANDGWGPDMLGRTFAHETGHLFGAQDEYGNCDCAKNDLYEVQINGNCVNCVNKPKKICIMKQNALGWIVSTREQAFSDGMLLCMCEQVLPSHIDSTKVVVRSLTCC